MTLLTNIIDKSALGHSVFRDSLITCETKNVTTVPVAENGHFLHSGFNS